MEKLYTVSKIKTWANCDSHHQLLLAKFRLKLKKAGEITRLVRHDLNQIPYEYTVEVTNRFKGLDVVNSMLEELWTEVHNTAQQKKTNKQKNSTTGSKYHPKEKEMQEVKEVLHIEN